LCDAGEKKGDAVEAKTSARVIFNPVSGGGQKSQDELRDELDTFVDLDWVETEGPEDAYRAASEWRDGLLIVAGGDGTVNEAVNGLGQAGFPDSVTLALLPSGTGNDLAATLAIPENADEAEVVIREGRTRTIDAARITSLGVGERFFVNVATGGIGAEISGATDEELKGRWGKLSYLRASLEVARDFEVREVSVWLDGKERRVRAVNIVVGNCRYAGGGWLAAPRANPEDGLLDVVIVEDAGIGGMLSLAPGVLGKSDYLDNDGVFFARAREVRVETSPGGLQFTADGEVIGDEPVEFNVIPRALKVIVGPGYAPEPGGGNGA
jgi:diacylglycerol kinase (ATP)